MKKFMAGILFSFYGLSLGAMQVPYQWINNPGQDTDDNVSALILDATQSDTALGALKKYIEPKPKRCLQISKIPYKGESLSKHYATLQEKNCKNKKEVLRLLRDCTLYKLIESAKKDPNAFDAFKSYFDEHVCDIDKVFLNPLDPTDGYIGDILDRKPSVSSAAPQELAYAQVYAHVQPYRSNPPDSETLRDRIEMAMDPADDLAWLGGILKPNSFNIDLIYKQGNSGQTLGAWLDSQKSDPQIARILALDRIKNFRMATLLSQRILDVLDGKATRAGLSYLYNLCPLDIDTLEVDPTTGKSIATLISEQITKPKALYCAKLFQGKRTHKQSAFLSLFIACEHDPANAALLEDWFTLFPCNIDYVLYDASKPLDEASCGDRLDARKDPAFLPFLAAKRSKLPQQAPKPAGQRDDEDLKKAQKASWLSKNLNTLVVIGSSLATIAVYFYLRTPRHDKQEDTLTHSGVTA